MPLELEHSAHSHWYKVTIGDVKFYNGRFQSFHQILNREVRQSPLGPNSLFYFGKLYELRIGFYI